MMVPVGRLVLLKTVPRSELVRAMSYVSLPALHRPGDRAAARRLYRHLRLVALDLLHQHPDRR